MLVRLNIPVASPELTAQPGVVDLESKSALLTELLKTGGAVQVDANGNEVKAKAKPKAKAGE